MKNARIRGTLLRIVVGTLLGPVLISLAWVILLFVTGSGSNAPDDLLLISAFWIMFIFLLATVPSLLFAVAIEFVLRRTDISNVWLALVGGAIGFLLGSMALVLSPSVATFALGGSVGLLVGMIIASVMGRLYKPALDKVAV
jgi:hypothetical protein